MGEGLSSEYAMTFEAFEKLHQEEHVPMIVDKLVGKTRFVATKVVATPDGTPPPFYRIAEVHFPSLEALQACAQSAGGKNPRPCCRNLEWWRPDFSGRGRANVYFWQPFRVGPDKSARVTLIYISAVIAKKTL